ncbi:hypothetical protein CEXT_282051 [Caerostris extrusa]|uniref:Uncharacterized protein n=1 Tax=Caerostris extrusa TaxID=172846 RepID=A0AAV4MU18_CAEEX|nr:hypothetical protein CEXT_282051 [Caerostris extrusa]
MSASGVRGHSERHWISGGGIEVAPIINYSTTNSFAAAIVAAAPPKGKEGFVLAGFSVSGICCHPVLNICIDFDTFLFSYALPSYLTLVGD